LHHLVAKAPWDNEAVLAAVRRRVLPVMQQRGPIVAWIVDDTGIPKKGRHSVGVARQYCGQLGKQENCQVAVSLSVATGEASLPIGWRLYLPEEWARDRERRRRAGVPEEIAFETRPEIALGLIRRAVEEDVPTGVVLADAAYGSDTKFREGREGLVSALVAGVHFGLKMWRPQEEPLPPMPRQMSALPSRLLQQSAGQKPVSAREPVLEAGRPACQTVCCRGDGRGGLRHSDGVVRMRPAHSNHSHSEPNAEHRPHLEEACRIFNEEWRTGSWDFALRSSLCLSLLSGR
jgi:SRSO17 transposase